MNAASLATAHHLLAVAVPVRFAQVTCPRYHKPLDIGPFHKTDNQGQTTHLFSVYFRRTHSRTDALSLDGVGAGYERGFHVASHVCAATWVWGMGGHHEFYVPHLLQTVCVLRCATCAYHISAFRHEANFGLRKI